MAVQRHNNLLGKNIIASGLNFSATAIIAAAALAGAAPASAASVISLGPRSVQALVAAELFARAGRWYLIDDGGICYTYLEFPRVRQSAGRLVLSAHLSSLLGQRVGDDCLGARFSSNITLSGRLHGAEHQLVLDDIRIDRVDDEATRNALNLALQLDPQALPRSTTIDISDYLQTEVKSAGGVSIHMDQFRILSVATQTDAIVIQFEINLTAL